MESQIREELQAELRRMARVFLDGANPIVIEDRDGKIIDLNDETERFHGWTHKELVGKSIKKPILVEIHARNEELLE